MHGLIWKALGSNNKSAFKKYSFSQMMAILWSAPAFLEIYITFGLCCVEALQNDQEKKENGVCRKRNHIFSGPNKQVIFESINYKICRKFIKRLVLVSCTYDPPWNVMASLAMFQNECR